MDSKKTLLVVILVLILLPLVAYLLNNSREANMEDKTMPSTNAPSEQLFTGTQWQMTLQQIDGQMTPPVEGAAEAGSFTLNFTSDTDMSGKAGCNNYFGTYTTDGNSLLFPEPIGSTLMACEEVLMAQEVAFTQNLSATQTFVWEDSLVLFDENDNPIMELVEVSTDN